MVEPRKYSGSCKIYVGWPGGEGDHDLEEPKGFCDLRKARESHKRLGHKHLVSHIREFGPQLKNSVKSLNDLTYASDLIRFMFRNIFLFQCIECNVEK